MSDLSYLYVEDDRTSRMVMEMILKDLMGLSNYRIFEDSTNFRTRLVALPMSPNVILLDIHVKPINGFEMLKIIRTEPGFTKCRVIALTASVMNEEVDALRQAGFDGTIGKPLDVLSFPDLLQRIQSGESVWQIM